MSHPSMPARAASPGARVRRTAPDRLASWLCAARTWWAAGLVWAAIVAWSDRHLVNPDGLSYLDLASDAVAHGPGRLVNAYWSPAYPALLGLALLIVRPAPAAEVPLMHGVNVLMFGAALAAFSTLITAWTQGLREWRAEPWSAGTERWLTPLGGTVVLWMTMEFIGVSLTSPDLLVAAVVFLAAGMVLRLSREPRSRRRYLGLGLVLGLGYWTKAILLPAALALLAILWWRPPGCLRRAGLAWSLAAFLLAAAPLVVLTSRDAGRLTFGESGRLNYVWYVTRAAPHWVGWTGDPAGAGGTPAHPPRTMLIDPLVLEFASPVSGTYPLWYDPAYWHTGIEARFDFRRQASAVKATLREYAGMLGRMVALAAGVVVMALLVVVRRSPPRPSAPAWLFAWPAAVCGLYALVYVEPRFVGAFLTLVVLAVYGRWLARLPAVAARRALPLLACALAAVLLSAAVARQATSLTRNAGRSSPPDYLRVAAALRDAGVAPGAGVAMVGEAFNAHFARVAGARVIAQVMRPGDFWRLAPEARAGVARRLREVGATAIVAYARPPAADGEGWIDVETRAWPPYSILPLGATTRGP